MLSKSTVLLIIGLSLFYSPSHSREVYKEYESLPSSVEEIAEEMNNLNSNLDLLSITISRLVSRMPLESSF